MIGKALKVLGMVTALSAAAAAGLLTWLVLRKPAAAPPSAVNVAITPARLARGKYLFEQVADCDGCHSQRDFTRFSGPVVTSGRGRGFVFPAEIGLPGTVVAPNITPDPETGLGKWTDGEKIRAIREGIHREGHALFPMMPYRQYGRMSDEDVSSLVAYMNSLAPIRNPLPRTTLNFPASVLIKGAPKPVGRVPEPDRSDPVKYGEYLAALGGCAECHTRADRGSRAAEMEFAGGRQFAFPGAVVVSSNITPDPETGIGKWSDQDFLDRFYQYRDYVRNGAPKAGPENFTLMPWLSLSQLAADDLKAIHAFLKSRKPVFHAVETHPPGVASSASGASGL